MLKQIVIKIRGHDGQTKTFVSREFKADDELDRRDAGIDLMQEIFRAGYEVNSILERHVKVI